MKPVGIVGTGFMGRGIAQVTAQAGFEALLFDARAGAATQARDAIAAQLGKLAEKGKLDAAGAEQAIARVKPVDVLAGLAACGLVVEAIVEDLEAKRDLFHALEAIVAPDCLLATNTSSLSVTAIAAACARPGRVAGLHFFSPVPLMKIVEVIDGVRTEPGVIAQLVDFAERLGHLPVRAKDTPGFLVNHAGRGYGTEALRILSEGVANHETVDDILRDAAGFKLGPFELLDLTGLDVSQPVMESIYRQFYDEPRFRPTPLLAQRRAAGLLGRKSGEGFYRYADGKRVAPPASPARRAAPLPARIWISARDPEARARVASLLQGAGASIDGGETPHDDALCVVLPWAEDATTAAVSAGLDPARTVALDAQFGLATRRTLMTTPVTAPEWRDAAASLFGAGGVPVSVIRDSMGFVAPRVVCHIVNVACDIAQQRIATPEDIDRAVMLGLGYRQGPLAMGDALGAAKVLELLEGLLAFYGDPRYRPSPWLKRRALLGVLLTTPED
ncbi:MAG: 3-hydroxyacyl-CoA dehydrogenase [Usitatibacter sp.]